MLPSLSLTIPRDLKIFWMNWGLLDSFVPSCWLMYLWGKIAKTLEDTNVFWSPKTEFPMYLRLPFQEDEHFIEAIWCQVESFLLLGEKNWVFCHLWRNGEQPDTVGYVCGWKDFPKFTGKQLNWGFPSQTPQEGREAEEQNVCHLKASSPGFQSLKVMLNAS